MLPPSPQRPEVAMSDTGFDVVIAGGGSAGAVLAARLSEQPGLRVALVEAGPGIEHGAVPAVLASQYPGRAQFNPDWFWTELRATFGELKSNQPATPRGYEQPRVLGGGSSVNGIGANRGQPSDYDEWHGVGATGWAWSDVLPYFRKLERDLTYGLTDLHNDSGPLPIQRIPRTQWTGFTRAVAEAVAPEGLGQVDDQNGPWQTGQIPTAINIDEHGNRASTALAYLTPEVRRRPNLTLLPRTLVRRILFDGHRATGLLVRGEDGAERSIAARHVVVAAGAIGSPAMLMRSGIGPGAHLQSRGIPVIADRPGVGENLQEHPATGLSVYLAPHARGPGGEVYHLQTLLRWSSGLEGTPEGDMHMAVSTRGTWHAVGRRIGGFYGWVNKSYSRGRVRLADDIDAVPEVDFRMLSDRRDLLRLMQSFRLSLRILSRVRDAGAALEVFPSGYSEKIKQLARPTARNGLIMNIAGPLMDSSAALRRRMLAIATENAPAPEHIAADDDRLEEYLRRVVGGVWHPCGTCRMGDPRDPNTVADPEGRVLGVDGLTVCDASVMPTIPCANLNVPVIMIAEKISDALKRNLPRGA
jgi:5-(hydroxymethyl)furfural/furfural oxidase